MEAGAAHITAGLVRGRRGRGLAAVGLVPLATGAFDWCLLAPLIGLPFEGPALRHALGPGA